MGVYTNLDSTARETSPCRSWVMFNGTGTVSIFTSFNVSSIGDSGAGNYRVNLSHSHANNQYCCLVTGTAGQSSGGTAMVDTTSFQGNGSNYPNSSTSYQVRSVTGTGSNTDMAWINAATWKE
mgnify:CR=1 FL=1